MIKLENRPEQVIKLLIYFEKNIRTRVFERLE